MIRCKDIAAMVGVSRQAVTAVLNNSRPNCVSDEKRTEILKIAAKYNYRPNHAAHALKTGKSNLIGIVMPSWKNPYIAELCVALQQSLAANNYVPFFTIDNNYNPVPGNLEQLLSLQIAGIITVASSLLPDNIDIPVVSYFYDDPRFDSVCTDAELNSRQTIDYLKKCGHHKIGYLGWMRDKRVRCLIAEAERCGMEFHERWQIGAANFEDSTLFKRLLDRNCGRDLPTALIIHNDDLALRIIRQINDCGFRVPEDFSVIGHDNVSYSCNLVPALTTMGYGTPAEIAESMVQLLLKQIKNPQAPREKVVLKSELIQRESVCNLSDKQSLSI